MSKQTSGTTIWPRVAFWVFIGLSLLCLIQAWHYYPLLPERVVSHFGPTGRPDAWTTKKSFFEFQLILISGLVVIFSLLGWLTTKLPPALINLPRKDYWLAEERRKTTLDLFTSFFFWFASATMALLLDIFHQAFLVQLGRAKTLTHPVLSLGVYISFTVIMTVVLLIRFIRKKS